MLTNVIRQRVRNGDVLFCTLVDSYCADMVEILGLGGFDFAILDGEHSPADPAVLVNLLRAAESRNLPAVIRVPNSLPSTILKHMDIGPSGIMAPLVHNAADAKAVVDAAKYCPMGMRGTAMMRGGDYGFVPAEEYFERSNDGTFIIVQVESIEGIRNLKAIAETPGVDAVAIGPYDLSQTMNMPGKVTSPEVLGVIKEAAKTIRAAGKAPSVGGIVTLDNFREIIDWGFQILQYSADLYIFAEAVRQATARFKGR